MKFAKYHALGNDYIVIEPAETGGVLTPQEIRKICHRNYGIGADGVLLVPWQSKKSDFGLRIFNPDGSEAEKSGNGLRIFSRYLWDKELVHDEIFTIMTPSGKVKAQVFEQGHSITIEMGRVSFDSTKIPVNGHPREVLNEKMVVGSQEIIFCAATIGNPHCVVLQEILSEEETKRVGPLIENSFLFPNRTNVQFMKIIDRANVQIEIWERGAGYTLASGSSSCAAAAVAHRLGLCNSEITVHMPGGNLNIIISKDFSVSMTGPVTKVAEGDMSLEIFS